MALRFGEIICGDQFQCPPITRITMPEWTSLMMPRSLCAPMLSE